MKNKIKVLWVTNTIIGDLSEKVFGKKSNGVWMDALLNEFKKNNEYNLTVVTTAPNKMATSLKKDNIMYYLLGGGYPIQYNHKSAKVKKLWKELMQKENPDIIMLWGNEFTHSLAALQAAPNVPSVVFMQGMLRAIGEYYYAGIDESEYRKNITPRDFIKRDSIIRQKKKYLKRAEYEKEIFDISGNIISENLWCNSHVKAVSPSVKSHYCPLSINDIFKNYSWSADKMIPHTILCNASGYPLKGLHILIRAVALLKEKYPDIKLLVPGKNMIPEKGLRGLIHKDGYMKYIRKLIKTLNVEKNIEFIGSFTQAELAEQISKANCFVVPSALENHSSSLKEAMLVGTPAIASMVGGVPEYITTLENGILYRFEEYQMLAEYISMIFEDNDFAVKLSENEKKSMSELHSNSDIYIKVTEIYKDILNNKNK